MCVFVCVCGVCVCMSDVCVFVCVGVCVWCMYVVCMRCVCMYVVCVCVCISYSQLSIVRRMRRQRSSVMIAAIYGINSGRLLHLSL